MTPAAETPIALDVLTGFLGAGKTTLLARLLTEPGLESTAVVINEFGEVGLDHLLVERGGEGIVELQGGCLCCTIRGDLVTTLEDLLARRDAGEVAGFTRLVVETTGLADPAPILHTVMHHPWLLHRFRLESVVAVVDAATGMATLDAHPESVKQAAVADRLVLTKTDLADGAAAIPGLRARLAALNPAATVLDAAAGEAIAARLFDAGLYDPATRRADVAAWLRADAYPPAGPHHGHAHDPNRHDDRIRAFAIQHEGRVSYAALDLFLELLRSRFGANLLRLKAIVELAEDPDRPLVLHGVQHVFHPPARLAEWPAGPRGARLVCILRDADPGEIDGMFRALTAPAGARDAFDALAGVNPLAPGGGGFRP
jgi:G3E family GTPase